MDLNADVADWLSENGLELDDFLPLLRENMVENLEDLLFLASDDEDLEAMGLNSIQVMELMFALSGAISERDQLANDTPPQPRAEIFAETGQNSGPAAAAACAPMATAVDPNVEEWLETCGLSPGEFLPAFHENMVETLGDLLFLAPDEASLQACGLDAPQVMDLAGHVATAMAGMPAVEDDSELEPVTEVTIEEAEALALPPAAAEPNPSPVIVALQPEPVAPPKAKERKPAAQPKPKANPATKRQPKPPSSAASEAGSRLYSAGLKKNSMPPGAEVPRTDEEMSPRKNQRNAKPPRVASVALKRDVVQAFNGKVDEELQRKMLDKLEAEQRRREDAEWRADMKAQKEKEIEREKAELRARYHWELKEGGPAPSSGTRRVTAAQRRGPMLMSPGSAAMTSGARGGASFVERQEMARAQREEKIKAKKKAVEEQHQAELSFVPKLSRASKRLTADIDTGAFPDNP